MLISHRKKFIYTKTIKTAGTSVESYFEKYCMPEGEWIFSHGRDEYVSKSGIIGYRGNNSQGALWWNHMSAKEIRDRVDPNVWENYFKFCIVRDPFDKMVSGFFFQNRIMRKNKSTDKNIHQSKAKIKISDTNDDLKAKDFIEKFRSWVNQGGWVNDRDKYLIEGKICVDFFIHYENLYKGIKDVCERLKIPYEPEKIPKLKASHRLFDLPLSEYYDSETIKIVSDLYSFELDKFGYKAPS